MANAYHVYISNSSVGCNGRYLTIITDSLQNALSIAKSKCTNHEEVTSVSLEECDLIIDHAAVGSAQH
jgi:hypothetical protein